MTKTDFLLAGVGGQGVLTASDIVAEVGMAVGLDAKKSEIHGFSQRGGVVESHVRWGEHVAAPMGERGRIDYLLAFELMESARWIEFLKPGGVVIVNRQRILPMSATVGDAVYPEDAVIEKALRAVTDRIIYVDGLEVAKGLGNKNLANTVLLGALSRELNVDPETWLDVVVQRVPKKYVEENKKAFWSGRMATK
ncbi:MAG: indolepyruvate oxidoreductase subunit beta [Chloroflexi bacterium]|nr:indolepyruvate oxidoreductase subunit beta [Chloroflexota bacterium]